MFRRKPDDRQARIDNQARIIENLQAQVLSLHAQLVQQSSEADRRIAELECERDEWRRVAQDWEKHHESVRHD